MTITATQRTASGTSELTATERSALKKAAWRLLPLLTIAYLFNYFDRTVVGFAAFTMNRDIGLTSSQFGFGAGLLFITYCLFEIPSNLVLYRVGPRRWLARIMITWGIISASTAFVVGPYSFYAARLLLGAAEAGYFVGVTYYLSAATGRRTPSGSPPKSVMRSSACSRRRPASGRGRNSGRRCATRASSS
jgi:MFS transporter, ACS family, tartrate transporter